MSNTYTKTEILNFLKNSPIMSVALTNNNKPICSVLLFAIDDDFTIYFATHENTYKAKALKQNPQISLSIWEHKKMLIQADGSTEIITNSKDVDLILDKIVNSADKIDEFWPPILRIKNKNPYIIFKIKLSWLRATDLESTKITEKEQPFTEIKF